MTLLARTIATLEEAGLRTCDHKAWGALPLYAEGSDERVRVYRTAGKGADMQATLAVLAAAGFHATLAGERITITTNRPRPAPCRTRNGPRHPKAP